MTSSDTAGNAQADDAQTGAGQTGGAQTGGAQNGGGQNGGGLARRLGVFDATVIGLGLAAAVAYCNATASAQLAAAHPTSGGVYVHGGRMLGPWWGFLAGWGFLIGKAASCAVMALTFAAYAAPAGAQKPIAVLAVLVLTAVNYRGITRTAGLSRVIVVLVLAALAVSVAASLIGGTPDIDRIFAAESIETAEIATVAGTAAVAGVEIGSWYAILQAAGLIFFAFAGYARVATLAEEVRDPQRTVPRAILLALALTVLVYAVVAVAVLAALGPAGVAATSTPVAAAVDAGDWGWAAAVTRLGAAAACLGALLALIAGIGRTGLAMARGGDLPGAFAVIHPRHQVPHRVEIALAIIVIVLVLAVDLRAVIGFSSFGVLVYYLVANLSAFVQGPVERRFPRPLQLLGALGCTVLVLTLPPQSVLVGVTVFVVGIGYRLTRTILMTRTIQTTRR